MSDELLRSSENEHGVVLSLLQQQWAEYGTITIKGLHSVRDIRNSSLSETLDPRGGYDGSVGL